MTKPRKKESRRQRRYHPADSEPLAFDEHENPDWLVGSN